MIYNIVNINQVIFYELFYFSILQINFLENIKLKVIIV